MARSFWVAAGLGLAPALALAGPDAPAPERTDEVTYAYVRKGPDIAKVPLFAATSAATPIAQIDDDVVRLEELTESLAAAHEAQHAPGAKAGGKDFTPILERLIDAHLLVREGREMGIGDLPEVRQAVDEFREATARQMLQERALKGVAADPSEVERLYRDGVREWKVKSVLVAKEADAKWMQAQLEAGGSYDALAKRLVGEKKAKGGEQGEFLSRSKMLPEVLAALQKLKAGGVSPPVKLKDGFAILKVEEIRYPEDPQARAEAEKSSLSGRQKQALKKYYDGLISKHATIDRTLLKKLDFEAKKPGIAALAKDQRVIARIQGAKPITVAELTAEVQQGFYHGVEGAIKEKRVNREKLGIFDAVLSRRIVPLEARAQGIPESPELEGKVQRHANRLVFSKFIEKAIVPGLKAPEEELSKYYEQHKAEFAYPVFYKLDAVVFADVKDAQSVVEKLRSGTDWRWLAANAERQVPESKRTVNLDGSTVSERALPADLVKALTGAKRGDCRLYAASSTEYAAVYVLDVTASREQPFAEVRGEVTQRVLAMKLQEAVKTWADKLRKGSKVSVFITRIGS